MSRLAKTNLKVVYSDQNLPTETVKSIFLAGPTPRSGDVDTWRGEAVEVLKSLNYDGIVFIPEPSTGEFKHSYDDQVEWELAALNRADIIVFWVPRELKNFPAFTTNVEFGTWITSGKVAFGYPPEAEKMRYLEYLAKLNNVESHSTLKETLKEAVDKIGDGADRKGGEVEVPLYIWKTPSFQNWYEAQTSAGNILEHAKLLFNARSGLNKDNVFFWILWVDMYVAKENRNKTIEFVASRSNATAVLLYKKSDDIMNTEVVLVKEFRSPASTDDGYVWELPGGSSENENDDEIVVAVNEVKEETGFKIDKSRIKFIQQRQVNETLLANQVALFAAEITQEEVEWFKSQKDIAKGNIEDTERTFTEVVTLKDILENELVDWMNVGMIMKVVSQN
jgi:8-oxo-dGTP pyrophosphatase MutT (NUDIX family)